MNGIYKYGEWYNSTPPHTKPGTISDYFLCIPIDSDIPRVLVYMHEDQEWTSGGGDRQLVRWWSLIPQLKEDGV